MVLDEKGVNYEILNYQPKRTRFELSNNLRVIKINIVDDYLTILLCPEQQPYIDEMVEE